MIAVPNGNSDKSSGRMSGTLSTEPAWWERKLCKSPLYVVYSIVLSPKADEKYLFVSTSREFIYTKLPVLERIVLAALLYFVSSWLRSWTNRSKRRLRPAPTVIFVSMSGIFTMFPNSSRMKWTLCGNFCPMNLLA